MRHGRARRGAQDVEDEVAPRAERHGPHERDQQEKDSVEEDGNPEDEAADPENKGSPRFAEKRQGRTHDLLGAAAGEQAGTNDRRHGDEQAELRGGVTELGGDLGPEGFLGARRRGGRGTALRQHMALDVRGRGQGRDDDGAGEHGHEGVQLQPDNAGDDDRHADEQEEKGIHGEGRGKRERPRGRDILGTRSDRKGGRAARRAARRAK